MTQSAEKKIPALSRFPIREILLCGFLAACALLPSSPLFQRFPFRDSGAFLYTGWRMQEGEVPYRDVWDHKPPLIYFINAAGLTLGGGSAWGVWALEWISLGAACLLAYRLLKQTFGPWPAGICLPLMLGAFFVLAMGGNLATEYALPMQFACLFLAAGMGDDRPERGRMFLLGILGGCLFLLKQNLIGIPAIVAAYRILSSLRRKQGISALRETGYAAAGAALAFLPALGYFAVHGALTDLWDAAFRYNFFYAETGVAAAGKSVVRGLEAVSEAGFGILGWIGWSAGAWLWARGNGIFRTSGGWLKAALFALPVELLLAALPGRVETHYYLSLLPAFSVFAALALWALLRGARFHELSFPARLAGAALLSAGLFAASAPAMVTQAGACRANDYSDVTDYLRANSTAQDGVLFWGAEAGLNFATQRASPTRYAYLYPLYHSGYAQEADAARFFAGVRADPPLWIVDTKNPVTPFLEIPAGGAAQAEFREWFEGNYAFAAEIHGWRFYRRKSS
ncbi:MAG: glycosyltransferase family 39 protein [Anaerolineales bacterium]|nr:glycosyltransferase family 39 protein [Anaerolineales bacterium]